MYSTRPSTGEMQRSYLSGHLLIGRRSEGAFKRGKSFKVGALKDDATAREGFTFLVLFHHNMLSRIRLCLFALLAQLVVLGFANSVEAQVPRGKIDAADRAVGWSWSDCGLDTDVLHIKSIMLSPDPPQPGKNLTVSVDMDVISPIKEGAYADVVVKLGLIELLTKRFDFCEEAHKTGAGACPFRPGSYTAHRTVALPSKIPPAKFSIHLNGYNVNDDDMFCLDVKMDFKRGI